MRRTILTTVLTILLLGGIGYRCLLILPYPIGTGDGATSPDGALVASVMQYHDETFWGSTRDWGEFEIRRKDSNRLPGNREMSFDHTRCYTRYQGSRPGTRRNTQPRWRFIES